MPPPSAPRRWTDQRGNPRPLGAGCDVGATEFGADLQTALTADTAGPLPAGGQATFTTTVTNVGPDIAPGVTVTDSVPSGATVIAAISSVGDCSGTGTVTCDLGTLARGASARVRLVLGSAPSPSLAVTAGGGTAGAPDPNPANNGASLSIPVGVAAVQPPPAARIALSGVSMLRTRLPGGHGRHAGLARRGQAQAAPARQRLPATRFPRPPRCRSRGPERVLSGRRVGSRCVKQTKANRKRPKCTRYSTAGTLRRNSPTGRRAASRSPGGSGTRQDSRPGATGRRSSRAPGPAPRWRGA